MLIPHSSRLLVRCPATSRHKLVALRKGRRVPHPHLAFFGRRGWGLSEHKTRTTPLNICGCETGWLQPSPKEPLPQHTQNLVNKCWRFIDNNLPERNVALDVLFGGDVVPARWSGSALTPRSELLSTALPDGEHTREEETQRSPQKPRSSHLARGSRLASTRQ
jgi:hypothetical protein